MGTWISHLRIAETLLDRLPGLDQVAFTFGCLAPDSGVPNKDWTVFDPPKEISHFLPPGGGEGGVQDLLFYRQYLQPGDRNENPAIYSFSLGYFVHLVSDRLWAAKIGSASRQCYMELFISRPEFEAWNIIKEDWYGLDHLYIRDHPNCLFWQVFLNEPTPASPFPFVHQKAFDDQMQYIRIFYSHPSPDLNLERPFPYLNETAMTRYIEETSACIIKIMRLLSACPPPEGLASATLLLPSSETAAFEPPLGDSPDEN